MTTHYVDIRLRSAGVAAPWEALTQAPIPFKDAKGLVAHIGKSWEARIRPVSIADDVPTLLERLDVVANVPKQWLVECRELEGAAFARWMDAHQDELLTLLRSGVFGIFEKYRGELGLPRWRPTNNVPKHKKGCKRSRVEADVRPAKVDDARQGWATLTEIDARAAHINAVTLPGLGISAAFVVGKPQLHTATCKSCGASSHAFTIACEVIWGDHYLTREYEV